MIAMAEILLFHHALGLTTGVTALADRLRAAGHTVHTPDLYDGQTFETVASGVDHARSLGFGNLVERGAEIAAELPEAIVYAGISMGVMPAQNLAQNRAGARGALFFESSVPAEEFGGAWPAGVPLQIHGMDADPEFVDSGDVDAARELVAAADDGELFLYPGDQHLFLDESLPSYDAEAAALATKRVLEFLARV
jgi:dienelactone hydrolase